MFLDSLDECKLHVETVTRLLSDHLRQLPVERLRLRVACRTLDWSMKLEDVLKELWGVEGVGVYELLRLTRADVSEAARRSAVDEASFLKSISMHGVGPLACKPVTLRFLLGTYKKSGSLPADQVSLYAEGCRLLCQELDPDRAAIASRTAALSPDQRLLIAARIAAVTLLGSRAAIFVGLEEHSAETGDVTVRELIEGQESSGSTTVDVNESAVQEVLGTALFSSRGAERLGWDHQSYAEFLAARYLSQTKLDLAQVLSLILVPSAGELRVVPQLASTTAWLSTMRRDVFEAVVRRDPQTVVRGGLRDFSDDERAALTAALLDRIAEGRLVDSDFDMRRGYANLKHPTLASQLRPYLQDRIRNQVVRRVAIDIAEACALKDLTSDLVHLATDSTEVSHIRSQAAHALVSIAAEDVETALRQLVGLPANEDPDDELKGIALSALWPKHISATELLAVLDPPRRLNFFGAYRRFLIDEFASELTGSDLPAALRWVESRTMDGPLSPLRDVEQQILNRACQHLMKEPVLDAFARVLLTRGHTLFSYARPESVQAAGGWLTDRIEERHRVAEAAVLLANKVTDLPAALVYSRLRILTGEDFPWLLAQVVRRPNEESTAWLRLARSTFDPEAPQHAQLVLDRAQTHADIAATFSDWIQPVELDSERAEELRRHHKFLWQAQPEEEPESPLLEPSLEERVHSCLDRFDTGDLNAWWILNREMTIDPASVSYGNESESDLRRLPGWQLADANARERIRRAARRYLELRNAPLKWRGRDFLDRSVIAGYRALRLLLAEWPQALDELSVATWRNWAPIVVGFREHDSQEGIPAQSRLISKVCSRASEEFLRIVDQLITEENRRGGDIGHVLAKVKLCWDDRTEQVLMRKLSRGRLAPRNYHLLLAALLEREVDAARSHALSALKRGAQDGAAAARSIQAGVALFQHSPADNLQTLLELGKTQPGRARGVFLELAATAVEEQPSAIGQRLSEQQLAELYVWLSREFPDEDDQHDRGHLLRPRDAMRYFKDGLLRSLRYRGTQAACVSLDWIASQLPHLEGIRWLRPEAERIMLERAWRPAEPAEILALARRSEARLVQTPEQLSEVVRESLRRLENELHGETPLVASLWNEVAPKTWRPKEENHLSDVIKVHLEKDLKHSGILAFREVEIRSTRAAGSGQATDIHVDVATRQHRDRPALRLKLIIEVKGCWNAELRTDMEGQLRNRYLQESDCREGIYLVGWFLCPRWDEADYRKRQTPQWSLNEARAFFDRQASQLSTLGINIRAVVLDTALRGPAES